MKTLLRFLFAIVGALLVSVLVLFVIAWLIDTAMVKPG